MVMNLSDRFLHLYHLREAKFSTLYYCIRVREIEERCGILFLLGEQDFNLLRVLQWDYVFTRLVAFSTKAC